MRARTTLAALAAALCAGAAPAAPLRIEARVTAEAAGASPLTGRLLVAISRDPAGEPRDQIVETYDSQQVFGVDVRGGDGRALVIDDTAAGFPVRRLSELHLGPGAGVVKLTLDRTMPEVEPAPADTPFLKHLHLRDPRLSRFWGRDVFLDAWVLLPAGWAEHPQARYPLVLYQDHFEAAFRAGGGWRETPPEPGLSGAELKRAQAAYANYTAWTSGRLPRVILVAINHANPFYDDSYAVNSANIGPYGDAITLDMVPEIERRYRGIGQGWARALYGGSTGGWETLATQVFYPDSWNGAWGSCPDPVDFHRFQAADLYDEPNAYVRSGPFGGVEVVSDRSSDAEVSATMRSVNQFELALGSHGRSAQQYDAWQAVFSPVGPDGYPAAIYDKRTGAIDPAVAAYWRDRFDLTHILQRDWARLGPKLEGKLHVAVGESDTYYLNNAVHLMDDALQKTRAPRSDAQFDYGPRAPHCYTGRVPEWARASGVTLNERILPQMAAHWLATAPEGADVRSWRY